MNPCRPSCTVPSYEQFDSAVRLEAAWMLTLFGCLEVATNHNSDAFYTPESSGRGFPHQSVHATLLCLGNPPSNEDEYQKAAQDV